MWPTNLVLSVVFSYHQVVGGGSEVFDVTSIYDVSDSTNGIGLTGRVHSRNNALGLPLINGYGQTREKLLNPNITCDSIRQECSWTLKGWALSPSSLPDQLKVQKQTFVDFGDSSTITFIPGEGDISKSNIRLVFISKTDLRNCDGYQDIVLLAAPERISLTYRVCSCGGSGELMERDVPDYGRGYYGYRNLYCSELMNSDHSSSTSLQIQLKNGKIYLIENKKSIGQEWTPHYTINYLYVKGDYGNALELKTLKGNAYTSKAVDSEMISPLITMDGGKLCLTVVFYVTSISEAPAFDIFSEDFSVERQLLYSMKDFQSGWNVKHIDINYPSKKMGPIKVVLKKTSVMEVKIARISSYSCDGKEVEVVSTGQFNSTRLLAAINNYSVTAYAVEPAGIQNLNGSTLCLNGGVWTQAGCACPPGFSGVTCQSGCGRNRFGQDCGGLCSLRQSECRGLLMCTYSTGCHCAPGYQGTNCLEECPDGYYGNDCQHKCGYCSAGSSCDIYTGECSSCVFGYIPPSCTKESVYYAQPPLLSSPEYGVITTSFDPEGYNLSSALKPPVLFQIQYREKSHDWKTYVTKRFSDLKVSTADGLTSERLTGLKVGARYQVRVLLMDEDFNKYDGILVGSSEIVTKCDIPEEYNYKVTHNSDDSSLNFFWSYVAPASSNWCPLELYEVSWKEDWKWMTDYTYEGEFSLNNLLPGSTIQFKVRAKTSGGVFPFSELVNASTFVTGLTTVINLNVEKRKSSSVELSWDPPRGSGSQHLRYTVSYRCVDRPACSPGCHTVKEGQQSVQDTHTTLSHLLPSTRYQVTVTPEGGKPASVYIGTTDVVPTEVPSVSEDQRPVRTNTSLTVYWKEAPVCSSFLVGYNYQLSKESESLNILESGFTRNNNATFHNLTASTKYVVQVFITTIAGWNPNSFLAINVSTSATVPEAVRNLTVYKRSRGTLGLRWAPPSATYGQLKSFTVSHSLGQEVIPHTVEPSHCVAWPDMYCHTIEGLRSNRRYNITVSARNMEVSEDGEPVTVTAITKESSPTAPVNLKLLNSTSTTLVLEWDHPEQVNGILRSFLVSIEETEKNDQDSCCQVYPLVETSVKEESRKYETEVSGLHPASTYFVSVSAKTVGLGPSQSLIAYTRPPHLPLSSIPKVIDVAEVSWLPQDKLPEVNNSDVYKSLIRAHLLLAVLNDTGLVQAPPETGISDPKLDLLLKQEIRNPFFFIIEYNQDDDVEVTRPLEDSDSPWGRPTDSLSPEVSYQLVAVQVLEYNGVYNVDLRYSQPFSSS